MFCFMDGQELSQLETGPTGITYYRCVRCQRFYAYREAAGQYKMEEMTNEDMEVWELTELGKQIKKEMGR